MRLYPSGPATVRTGAGFPFFLSQSSSLSMRSWNRSATAVTTVPGTCERRRSAEVPREPTPMHATRTFFIGLSAHPCIGAPLGPVTLSRPPRHSPAMSATPIQAAE